VGRLNAKGRNKHTRHVRIDHSMMTSDAWRALSGGAVKVLLHLASIENGTNNGAIGLSVRDAGEATGLARSVAARALAELTDSGFIIPTSLGAFSVKTKVASTWRLTWLAWPGRMGPTNDFLR
jgi:hypothetical protein